MKNTEQGHKSIFVTQIVENARADLDEAQRQVARAKAKINQLAKMHRIKLQLDYVEKKCGEIDDQLASLVLAEADHPGEIIPFPISKAEGYELGLFGKEPS